MILLLMIRSTPGILLCALFALGIGAACSNETEVVDLSIVHGVYIDFDDMEDDSPEQAVVAMDDLREEADYVRYAARLRCGSLATESSSIEVTRLGPEILDTTLFFQLEIAPRGQTTWTPLVEFTGFVADGEVVPFSDPDITLSDDGLNLLTGLALSTHPAYDLRITGEVPNGLSDLEVDLELEIDFSSVVGHCH